MPPGFPTTTPNFSGTWIMDLDRSTFQSPNPPVSVRYVITQTANRIQLLRTDVFSDGSASSWSLQVNTNGVAVVTHGFPFITTLQASWNNGTLLLEEATRFLTGTTNALQITFALIERGRTLFSQERRLINRRATINKLYFTRKTV